jgi:Asp-tRNA(Asn)/Glu-tRNA(Gln) amidotransferase A subunit family amidase
VKARSTLSPMSVPLLDSAGELASLVRRGELSPVELLDATLSRLDAVNPTLNAFVGLDVERARRDAQTAERAVAAGAAIGPLHGIPVSIKSCLAVAGMPWETGTRLRAGVRARSDAPLVARLRAAGAIVIGVTNVAEQLMAWETDNLIYGRTNNPWALDRTPGGSSGGEAAAIASGMSAGGVGSDGGGSIRVPAHFSGICGLKPTPGRVPATGHFPTCAGPFALTGVVGPMARTIDDVETLLRVMAGPDIGDPNGHPVPFSPMPTLPADTRIGWFEDDEIVPVTPETREAVRRAAGWLSDAGYFVEPFRPTVLEDARAVWWQIFGCASRLLLEPLVAGHERDVHPNLLEFLEWTREQPRLTAERLLTCEIDRDLLKTRLLAEMSRYPVLLCPVAPIPAFRHGERRWQIERAEVQYLDAWRYTAWFNLLQNPAVSVPVLETRSGLPIGVQVIARPWEEGLALAAARVIEQSRGVWKAPPAFAVLAS